MLDFDNVNVAANVLIFGPIIAATIAAALAQIVWLGIKLHKGLGE